MQSTFNRIYNSWQFGDVLPNAGRTSDDGNTIFTDDSDYNTLVVQFAAKMDARK